MASVQIRVTQDTYNKAVADKGRLSIIAYFANLQEEVLRLREELKKAKKK